MPKQHTASSSARRKALAQHIYEFGDLAVRPCFSCRQKNQVCKVHTRSGKCSECVKCNYHCNAKLSQHEFDQLAEERRKLLRQIEVARSETMELQDKSTKAMSKELRLRKQLDALEQREGEAITVEELVIQDQECGEQPGLQDHERAPEPLPPLEDEFAIPPSWFRGSALTSMPEDFYEMSDPQSEVTI